MYEAGAPPNDLLAPLRHTALEFAERPALRSNDAADLSHAALLSLVERLMADLAGCGITRGRRVALLLPTKPQTAVTILAIAACGTAVPLSPISPEEELVRILTDARIGDLLVSEADSEGMGARIATRLGLGLIAMTPEAGGATGTLSIRRLRERSGDVPTGDPKTALVLHTSGSTGLPKRVPLTIGNLLASATNIARSLDLSPSDTCLAMMPMFHIGALVDLLLAPLGAGGAIAFASSISTPAFFEGLSRFSPTWSQAVPTVLRDLMAHETKPGEAERMRRLRFIRAVSQPLPVPLQQAFEARFDTPLVPMYGMTETAGLITSMPLGKPRPGSVGVAQGVKLAIGDTLGNALAPGQRGEVLISGPTVMAGYEDDATPRSETFRGAWLRSGDEGYIDADGHLFLTGRIKDAINRGGEKISPLEIDLLLAAHPGIREAAAFPVPHPTLGEEVAVAIVPNGAAPDRTDIAAFLAGKVADYKMPRSILVLDRLPRVPSGKLDRRALPALAASGSGSTVRTPPDTAVARTLANLWRRTLGVDAIAMEDDFFNLGGDSLNATTLALKLESYFGRALPVADLFEKPTLRAMSEALAKAIGVADPATELDPHVRATVEAATAAWRGQRLDGSLVIGRNTLGRLRPFHWVCQSVWQFEALSEHLDPERPFYILRSLSATTVKSNANTKSLASHYALEIRRLQPQGPYLVGGFCQGGVVAFEIARLLRASGEDVALLCLQDRFIDESYDGAVAMFCGKRGWFSPYDLNDDPRRAWAKRYRGPISIHLSGADHDDLHKPPFVQEFAARLEAAFAAAEAGIEAEPLIGRFETRPLDGRSYRSRVRAKVPVFMRQGSTRVVDVTVTNTSPVDWGPTATSGIILAARWRSLDPLHGYALDGRVLLETGIAAGASAQFRLPLRVPMRGLPLYLDIDLVDDGLYWFGGVGRSGLRRLVVPLPPL